MSEHKSDCAFHNAPAFERGALCDCGADPEATEKKLREWAECDVLEVAKDFGTADRRDLELWADLMNAGANSIARLSAANAELLEALAPFANVDWFGAEDHHSENKVVSLVLDDASTFYLPLRDFQRAFNLYAKHQRSGT